MAKASESIRSKKRTLKDVLSIQPTQVHPLFPLLFLFRVPLPTQLSLCVARFSPDDKYAKYRVTLKRRLGLLLTQQPVKGMVS
jgi:hypothetical protein